MKLLARILGYAAVIYIAAFGACYFLGERLAFHPPAPSYQIGERGYRLLQAKDGTPIAVRWLPVENSRCAVLYAHGNAEDIGDASQVFEEFRRMGFSVLAFDFTGYGHSGGRPSAAGMRLAAQTVWDFLTEQKNIAPDKIVVVGYSVGGAAACYLAGRENPRALVLVSVFASAFHVMVAQNPFPWALMDNRAAAKKTRCPVLMLHGDDDPVIPYRNARMLYAAFRGPKRLVTVPSDRHYGIFAPRKQAIWDGIRQFIEDPARLPDISFRKAR